MHAWISCIGVSYLSSLVLGVVLGFVLRGSGVCAVGFAAVHALALWCTVSLQYVRECLYKRDLANHVNRNRAFLNQTAATSAPRHVIPHASEWGSLALALLGGACDGFAVVAVPPVGGDSYALSLAAVALCSSRLRWIPGMALVYVMLTTAVPGLHGVIRALCLFIGTVLSHSYVTVKWRILRIAAGTAVVASFSSTCASKGIPPVLLLAVSLYSVRANPVTVLTFAALVTL